MASSVGRGKVKPRRAQAAAGPAPPAVVALDVLSHEARARGERPGDPPRRYPECLTDGDARQVPRFHAHTRQGAPHWRDVVRRSQPALLAGSPLLGDTSSKFPADHRPGVLAAWSWTHLAALCGGGAGAVTARGAKPDPHPVWPVAVSAPAKDRFIVADPDKNAFGSFYHVREPETESKALSFADFAACAREWRSRRVMLRARLAPPTQAAAHPQDVPSVPALQEELARLVDWAWLRDAVQVPLLFGDVGDVALVAASPGSLQPARLVALDTLLCQARLVRPDGPRCASMRPDALVRGRSRVLLIPPEHTYCGMYPFAVAHPYDGYSMVDFDRVDLGAWPRFASVRGQASILAPGELLFVPRNWWLQLQALGDEDGDGGCEGEHTVLEVCFRSGARVRTAEAALPAVGRCVEELAVSGEGVGGARAWLCHVAAGTDLAACDLGTVAGYKRIRLSTDIRDEVTLSLGRDTDVSAFLLALVEGRLTATPWLNANFREPLYLKDVPVQLADTRTEWELRFPQLFARKLALEGHTPPETPVSHLNPSHPRFIGALKPSGSGASA